MARVVSQLKRFFQKPSNENFAPFKQAHFLNTQSEQDMSAMLSFKEQKCLTKYFPELGGLNTLLVSVGVAQNNLPKILLKNPKSIIDFRPPGSALSGSLATMVVCGAVSSLPFPSACFDVVVAPLVTYRRAPTELLVELSRVLKNRGRAVITITHPFLELLLKNQNPAVGSQAETTVSDFFKKCREANLYWEDIGEGEVDGEMKSFFNFAEGGNCFEQFLGIPLVQCLRAIKFQRP